MDITILKKLNLDDKEIKIYLSLLEYGANSVRKIAEISGLNRGTVYDVLKKLQKVGLVSYYHTDKKQKFAAEDPCKLIAVLKQKQEELKDTKSRIESIIPELKSLQDKEGKKPVVKFYEGKAGIRFILEDMILTFFPKSEVIGVPSEDEDKEYYVYSSSGVRDDIYNAYPKFNRDRIKNNIKVKTLSLAKGGATYGMDERKWLLGKGESPTYILIYRNKCAYIARDMTNSPVGIIIENKMIYETQKLLFLKLWKMI